jgi:hypothetical protein
MGDPFIANLATIIYQNNNFGEIENIINYGIQLLPSVLHC